MSRFGHRALDDTLTRAEGRREHAARGVTLHQADCLIAAAVTAGATLATGNPDHFPQAEIDVAHWPVGA